MYRIVPLTKQTAEPALEFVCQEFLHSSVLHRISGVSYQDYLDYMRSPFTSMISEGLSFIAVGVDSDSAVADSNESDSAMVDALELKSLLGCIAAGDYWPDKNESEKGAAVSHVEIPDGLHAMSALFKELKTRYESKRTAAAGTVLKVDLAVVSAEARGKGIYSALRRCVHKVGREHGFSTVVGELSSLATQRFCVNTLGHTIVDEIDYDAFQYKGHYPFRSITSPKSIQIVEGKL